MPLKKEFDHTSSNSVEIIIWIGGDINIIKQICREYCTDVGLCVTVTPTDFIFTGGQESGAAIGLINYPRFPMTENDLMQTAFDLAKKIGFQAYQSSCCIVGPKETVWLSRRLEN